MNAQQLLDNIIVPTLEYMGGNYNSKSAQMLLLATAAVESKCGYYIKQINGPALGVWQMEPATHDDIWSECDALYKDLGQMVSKLTMGGVETNSESLVFLPMYACAMARLKYSMDKEPLPIDSDKVAIYEYYKRIYNTEHGSSTFFKFNQAWDFCKLSNVRLI